MARAELRGLTIAGLRLAIEVPPSLPWRWPDGPLLGFASSAEDPHMVVGIRVGRIDEPQGDAVRYDSEGGIFDVARDRRDWLIATRIRGQLQRLARFDEDFRCGEIVVDPDSFYAREAHYPLGYPLDEVLFLHRLAREGGLLVHACGVVRGRSALLFTGPAGAGKTTIARFMLHAGGCSVLSDDRIVIRPVGGRFAAFGTPWHGDAALASPASARLEGVHAIQHAPHLRARPLAGAEAAAALLANAFVPIHDRVAAERTLALAERLVARVPVIHLGFPNDPLVVPFAWGEIRLGPAAASPAVV